MPGAVLSSTNERTLGVCLRAVVEMVSTHSVVHGFMIMRGSVILGNSIVFNKPTLEAATSSRRQDTKMPV